MKPLDMADKYPPAEEWDDVTPTLPSLRNPLPKEEKTYPGIGLMIAFGTGILFWGSVLFFACR